MPERLNVREVARRTGVSPATVCRVLSNHPHVRARTRSKVLAAMEGTEFTPKEASMRARVRRTETIGVVVPNIANPFFTSVVKGIDEDLGSDGYMMFTCSSNGDVGTETQLLKKLYRKRIDGLFLVAANSNDCHVSQIFDDLTPIILIDRRVYGLDADMVLVANEQGAMTAVEHLITLGHARIGVVGGPLFTSNARERLEGYRRAFEKHGLPIDESLIMEGDYREAGGYELTMGFLKRSDRPTALFVANNSMAIGAISAIKECGLSVPRDVAIVTFDDLNLGHLMDPPLTAVIQPTAEIGRWAAKMFRERIGDSTVSLTREILLRPEFRIRQSCGASLADSRLQLGGITR